MRNTLWQRGAGEALPILLSLVTLAACGSSEGAAADGGDDAGSDSDTDIDTDTDTDTDTGTDDGYQESGTYGPWSFEKIADGVGGYTVAVDGGGTVHTLATEAGEGIHNLRGELGSWESEIVASENGYRCRLALDSEGNTHVCYSFPNYDPNPDVQPTLRYATDATGSWSSEILTEPGGDSGWGCFIAVDGQDHVHIVHIVDDQVEHLSNAEGSWAAEIIGPEYASQAETPLSVDTDDNLHTVFGNPAGDFAYYTNATGEWLSEVAVEEASTGVGLSASVDSAAHMHLSHCRSGDGMCYGTNGTGEWLEELFDEQGDCTGWGRSCLAVDSEDHPHVAYKGYGWELRYASRATGEWVAEVAHPADSDHQLASEVSLAIDIDGYAHIVYRNLEHNDVWYATNKP